MRRLAVLLIGLLFLSGCASPPKPSGDPSTATPAPEGLPPASDPNPPATPIPVEHMPTARQAGLANGLRAALPRGPTSVALLVDVPAETWEPGGPVAGFGGPDAHVLTLRVRFEQTTQPFPPSEAWIGALLYEVREGVAYPPMRLGGNPAPHPLEAPDFYLADNTACAPADRQYLVVLLVDNRADVTATIWAGAGDPPAAPAWIRPDAEGGRPALAALLDTGLHVDGHGWTYDDARNHTDLPPGSDSAVGAFTVVLEAGLDGPGFYDFSFLQASPVAQAGRWGVRLETDDQVQLQESPYGGAYASGWLNLGQGPFHQSLDRLSSTVDGVTAMPANSFAAALVPLDLAPLDLQMATSRTFIDIFQGLAVGTAVASLACP